MPCWFCDVDLRTDPPPTGWLYDDGVWRAGHAPAGYAIAGTVVLEACRHMLDQAAMTAQEAESLVGVTGRLVTAIRQATGCDRVYQWATMDAFPHFHLWLVPWSSRGAAARAIWPPRSAPLRPPPSPTSYARPPSQSAPPCADPRIAEDGHSGWAKPANLPQMRGGWGVGGRPRWSERPSFVRRWCVFRLGHSKQMTSVVETVCVHTVITQWR